MPSAVSVVRPRQYGCPVPPPAQCVTSPVIASALHGREKSDSLEVPAEPFAHGNQFLANRWGQVQPIRGGMHKETVVHPLWQLGDTLHCGDMRTAEL